MPRLKDTRAPHTPDKNTRAKKRKPAKSRRSKSTRAGDNPKPVRDWKPVFLIAYENKGTVKAACKIARVSRSRVYEARREDAKFAAEWDAAESRTTELLEETAFERAINGSDRLMEFLLKARRPKRYREHARVEGEADEEVSEAVNDEIEGLLAEVDRLRDRLADATAERKAPAPSGSPS